MTNRKRKTKETNGLDLTCFRCGHRSVNKNWICADCGFDEKARAKARADLIKNSRQIRISPEMMKTLNRANKARESWRAKHGQDMPLNEFSRLMKISVKKAKDILLILDPPDGLGDE